MKEFCVQARLWSPAGACSVRGNSLSCHLVVVHLSVGIFKAVACWQTSFYNKKSKESEKVREKREGREGRREGERKEGEKKG